MSTDSIRPNLTLLALALLCTTTTSALGATINVTTTADSGNGSMRAALAGAANGDTINAAGVSGTILLTNGQLMVTNSVTIRGPGPGNLAVSGNSSNRVFYISSNLVVTITGLTITNGFVAGGFEEGAGILNDVSTLTVSNCAFRGNQADFGGAIFYNGFDVAHTALRVSSSTFSSNSASRGGGAIDIESAGGSETVSVTGSTFSGNTCGFNGGGAILTLGFTITNETLIVSNCTFNSNRTDGGGLGGAIINLGLGTITAINSGFSNNVASAGGGAFSNDGENFGAPALTVSNCTIIGNLANFGGGLYNYAGNGTATIRVFNSTISSNSAVDPNGGGGGAIYNDGVNSTNAGPIVTLLNSTISGNSGASGGAIYNDADSGVATVSATNCTLEANSAIFFGGLVFNYGANSGKATLSLIASTVSSNSASDSGGAIHNYANNGSVTVTMLNSTLSGNSAPSGGGIYNLTGSPILNIGSTILDGGASGANIVNNAGTVISLGYNLSSDGANGSLTSTTDQINTDPRLGPLQDNGGTTLTHALLAGSPAIDKGKNLSGSSTDQRGFARTVDLCPSNAIGGDGTDIGAFELPVLSLSFTVINRSDSGPGSLRDIVLGANLCPDSNSIVFDPSAYGTITLTSGEIPITAPVSILGPGATNVSINGNSTSRIFHLTPGLNVIIAGVTMTNGFSNAGGGAIYNDHSILTVSNCTLAGNSVSGFGGGGAIWNDGPGGTATLTVVNSTLSSNSATQGTGGAIFSDGEIGGTATVNIRASTLSGNSANQGGGIYNNGETGSALLLVGTSTFSSNSALFGSSGGGAIYNDGLSGSAQLSLSACTLSGNSVTPFGTGGGILNQGALEIGDTIMKAGASGANLFNDSGTITSRGYNLSSDDGSGFLIATGDKVNTDPQLGPLQNNGGPTFTHALLSSSPAIDQGKQDAVPLLALNTDQRGLPRSVDLSGFANAAGGDGSDIGAFELQAVLVGTPMRLTSPQKIGNGPFQFSFTNTSGASFTVLSSTNVALPLSNWTVLGAPTEISPGHFQYSDSQATNKPRSFYGVRSP